jgi:hypothetical protein
MYSRNRNYGRNQETTIRGRKSDERDTIGRKIEEGKKTGGICLSNMYGNERK